MNLRQYFECKNPKILQSINLSHNPFLYRSTGKSQEMNTTFNA